VNVDLNCDMGESFGAYTIGADEAVLPFITSANIACGFHGGDPGVMRRTVDAAIEHGVAIGAHPGLPDLAGFGRRAMVVSPQEVYDLVVYQVGALNAFATAAGVRLNHVKAHGALYNMAADRDDLSDAIARAVRDVDGSLILFCLPDSEMTAAAAALQLPFAREVFADRGYLPNGMLVPRDRAGAHVSDVGEAVERAIHMVKDGSVTAIDGTVMSIVADTICIHGDGPHAAPLARTLRAGLESAGIDVRAPTG
jgi:UPF0271 protein